MSFKIGQKVWGFIRRGEILRAKCSEIFCVGHSHIYIPLTFNIHFRSGCLQIVLDTSFGCLGQQLTHYITFTFLGGGGGGGGGGFNSSMKHW